MSHSLYDSSIPVMTRGLRNLSKFLDRGRVFADETGVTHAALLEARLFWDMLPLTGQVQRASDTAKFAAVRLGQVENVAMSDDETSFDDLQARIAATIDFLEKIPAAAFEGREGTEISLPTASGKQVFTARDYLFEFALPNFLFHVTTAYNLLRHKGVPLGKQDFLGWR